MPKHALLNNVDHKHLRIITARGAAYGDAVMSALTFPAEFRELQAAYPIVFARSADGTSFDALALFGFEKGENLFLEERDGKMRWDAPAIPLSVEREPFLIGRGGEELSVHVDLDHPRVSTSEGEALFLTYGGTSEYLERIASVLRTLHDGLEAARGFQAAMTALDLFEPFTLDVELDSGARHRLEGFYTIHEERLGALSGSQLEGLQRAGWLQPAYMALASLSQFRALIDRRNRAPAHAHAADR